jgi:hypothetical protein
MSMTSITELYDMEGALETAACAVLTAAGLAPFSPAVVGVERVMPRVEVAAVVNGENGHTETVDGDQRSDQFNVSLILQAVCANVPSVRTMRAAVRDLFANPFTDLNAALPWHKLVRIEDSGSTPEFSVDGGYVAATLRFGGTLVVRPEAWAAYLALTQPN